MTQQQKQQSTEYFVSLIENDNPALEGRAYPVSQTIPMVDVIYEEVEGNPTERKIRYIKGAKSIYVDEQKGVDEKLVPEALVMRDGIFAVSTKEVNLLKFLSLCHYNMGAPNRMDNRQAIFRKVDAAKEAEEFLSEEKEYLELQLAIYNMDADELEAMAMTLGDYNADTKKTSELRRDLLVYAQNRPDEFQKELSKAENKYKVFVMRAIKRNVIEFNRATSEIIWKGGDRIVSVPAGINPEDHLTRKCMKDKSFFQQLRAEIEPPIPQDKNLPKETVENEDDNVPAATGMPVGLKASREILALANRAIKEEIIIRRLPGRQLGLASEAIGEKYYDLGKKNAMGAANLIAEDDELRQIIENQLKHGTVNS